MSLRKSSYITKAHILRHVPHEGAGTIETFLTQQHIPFQYYDLFLGNSLPQKVHPSEMLIVMGGPMNVDETDRYAFLKNERLFIGRAIESGVRMLGVCLGAQLIARSAGERVFPGPRKEIGWFPIYWRDGADSDPVFAPAAKTKLSMVFHWHGDTFDLPKGAVALASSDLYENQAFRIGEKIYGLQFHVEMTSDIIREWTNVNHEEVKALGSQINTAFILNETKQKINPLQSMARTIYERLFLA